tara:strand:- start:1126 stop:2310 length:1185 start_codon:yes stop_codon:yes gene_type:complete
VSATKQSTERPDQHPAGTRPRSGPLLAVLLGLAVLYTLHFAAPLVIPMVVALLLALALYPVVNFLNRLYVPRVVAGVLLLLCIGVPFTLLGAELAGPAQRWLERVPELTGKLHEQLDSITEAFAPQVTEQPAPPAEEASALERFFAWFDDEPGQDAQAPAAPGQGAGGSRQDISNQIMLGGLALFMDVLAATPVFLAQCLAVILLVLFLLVYGPGVYRTVIEVFPQIQDKEAAGALGQDTQRELSRYVLTVGTINAGLGALTATALWFMGFEDPLLWGVMVALLNFAPYVGPLLGATVIAIAGLEQSGFAWASLLPALVYFAFNAVEANLVTPYVLGRSMRINPLLTVLWLMLWGWLWGAAGVLIAVPLMICVKLVLARLQLFTPWLQLIESRQ